MKKLALVSLLLLTLSPAGFAAEAVTAQPVEAAKPAKPAKPAPKRTEAEQKKIGEIRKRIEVKKTDLNGSRWELALGSSDPKMKEKKDIFIFQDGMFKSENLSKRGFAPTNYTVSVPPDEKSETAVWETMQSSKEGLIFIRGEWQKDSMRGNVTEQLDGGKKTVEYYFTTSAKKSIPPSSKKEEGSGKETAQTASEGASVLVSAEKTLKKSQLDINEPVVEPFAPGTTDEIKSSDRN